MSYHANLRSVEDTSADEFFPDDSVPTSDKILSDADVPDDNGSASTPSTLPLPNTSASRNEAAFGDIANSEERGPRLLVTRRTFMHQKRDDPENLLSLLKAQIIQYGICRGEEHQRG